LGHFWRILIFGPIFWLIGLVSLLLLIAVFSVPPAFAIVAFVSGEWLFGVIALAVWTVVLRFRWPILRWTLDGIQYSSI